MGLVMVNRNNYTKVKAFLEYSGEVAQLKPVSVSRYGVLLKHLLVWADEHALAEAHKIRPSFPYLPWKRPKARTDRKTQPAHGNGLRSGHLDLLNGCST